MSQSTDSHDLGPLPKADRNAELQRRSIAVFQASLPPDKFVFRNEPADDAGVDGSLEALVDGEYTNLRSQVQLKSTDSNDKNSDGSVSVQVRVSNLNYLLNGPSPIYVLYVAPWNELRFAWARDERRHLDEANPEWNQQESITIRFNAIVAPETLEQIHQRIREEAQFQRKVNDILDVASSTEQIVVRINKDTLAVTDPREAKRILINSGTVIVSAGYAREVKNLIKLLDEEDAQTPRVLLVHAHAEFNLQRYESALALVGEASMNLDALSQEDRIFLQTIRDGSEFQTGRISITEFARRLDETSRSDAGGFALSNRLEQLRYNIFAERNPERRATLLSELEALVKEIVQSEVSHSLKIHARTCWVEAEGAPVYTGLAARDGRLADKTGGRTHDRLPFDVLIASRQTCEVGRAGGRPFERCDGFGQPVPRGQRHAHPRQHSSRRPYEPKNCVRDLQFGGQSRRPTQGKDAACRPL
jgi:hypothetical protein